jgi:hypothetical protein
MAEIRFSEYQLEDGVLVFNSGGDEKTIDITISGYKKPYNLFINVYDSDNRGLVGNYAPDCDYDDGDNYAIWTCRFLSQENDLSVPSTGYISVLYEEEATSYMVEAELPYYIKYNGEGEIHPFVSKVTFNADGTPENNGYDRITVGYNGLGIVDGATSNVDWITVQEEGVVEGDSYEELYTYLVEVEPNTGNNREGNITLSMVDTQGNTKVATILIKQKAAEVVDPDEPETPDSDGEVTYAPFWQDTIYTFPDGSEYGLYVEESYRVGNMVVKEDKLIYSGKIYAAPNEYAVNVSINRICQNYINDAYFPFDDNRVGISDIYKFKLKEYNALRHTYYFVRDWSYKPLTIGIKTNPIIPFIGTGQRLFFSAFAASESKSFPYEVKYYDGQEEYTNGLRVTNSVSTEIIALSRLSGVDAFIFGGKEYKRLPLCKCKYVMYYLNPYGGWDWLPIIGRVTKKDKIDQYTYTKNYNNTKADFGKYRYLSEIHTTYTLHTGWLSQAQSDRMWEVLESNCVYLHNLEEDKIMPVVLTHSDIEYKQKTNKSRMIDYEIIAEESQTKERI